MVVEEDAPEDEPAPEEELPADPEEEPLEDDEESVELALLELVEPEVEEGVDAESVALEDPLDVEPLEDPVLPPDELGGVDTTGGAVIDVSATTGSEEEPAVVATEPYSNAPMSQSVPRS